MDERNEIMTEQEEMVNEFLEELIEEVYEEIEDAECFHCLLKEKLISAWQDGHEAGVLETLDKFRTMTDIVEESLYEEYEEE